MIKKRPHSAREVAAFTLFSMAEEGAWSDGALHAYLSRAGLSRQDAALATYLVYGTVQNRRMCDFFLSKFSKVRIAKIAPRVLDCLRLGIFQLTLTDRIPAHAAVSETVTLVEQYAHANERTVGYVNGVLRAIARAAEAGDLPRLNCPDKESYYALRYSHPEWLVRAFSAQYGQKESGLICEKDNEIAPLSLRVNLLRATREEVLQRLAAANMQVSPHPRIENVILCAGGNIASSPVFEAGLVTVQDGAGAICAELLGAKPGQQVIDCCAAPGGKSFAIAEKMKNTGKVISCDIYAKKLEKIEEGALRLGLTNIETVQADASRQYDAFLESADAVLCDVPCSGMGIIRKKPEIRYKEESSLEGLPEKQLSILQNCAQYVKPGGALVYSTCTILQRENEAVFRAFLSGHPNFVPEPIAHPCFGDRPDGMVTLLPHLHETDGFFIAKCRRTR